MNVSKPLLREVIDSVEHYVKLNNKDIFYNIEIKSSRADDNKYHPVPEVFGDLVYDFIDGRVEWDRVTIQSFDFRVLQYFHEKYPQVKLAQLVENDLLYVSNIDSLGFDPDIYSCYYELLTADVIADLQSRGIKVIPWTVNDPKEMEKLVNWGVDGLITDYPDRFQSE